MQEKLCSVFEHQLSVIYLSAELYLFFYSEFVKKSAILQKNQAFIKGKEKGGFNLVKKYTFPRLGV